MSGKFAAEVRLASVPSAGSPSVALTHSAAVLPDLPVLLEGRGFQVERAPLVSVTPRLDEATRAAALALAGLPWLLLTSRNAVTALAALDFPFGSSAARFGAVGPGTASELQRLGVEPTVRPARHDALGLAGEFLEHPLAGGPVGLPRGNRALPTLEEELRDAGLEVRSVTVYDTVPLQWNGRGDVIVLASPSAVEALPAAAGEAARLVAIGPTTAAAVRKRGWECGVAEEATAAAVTRAVELAVRA